MRTAHFFVVALLAVSAFAAEGGYAGIEEITGVKPDASVIDRDAKEVPLPIRTSEELVKIFGKEQAQKIEKQVDFKRQLLVVFAWKGSGKDQLNYTILKSNPPQYSFTIAKGRTKDLKQHVHVYAIGLENRWSFH